MIKVNLLDSLSGTAFSQSVTQQSFSVVKREEPSSPSKIKLSEAVDLDIESRQARPRYKSVAGRLTEMAAT